MWFGRVRGVWWVAGVDGIEVGAEGDGVVGVALQVPMLVYLVPCWALCSVSVMAWVSSGWALISMKV